MIILGIDPGIATTGWAIIEKINKQEIKALDFNQITTKKILPTAQRLEIIYEKVKGFIDRYMPEALALEDIFFNTNAKTALLIGQSRGVVQLAAKKKQIPVFEYAPLQIKIAITGYGRAEKMQMQKMVKTLLKLERIPKPDDVADALAVALCHCYHNKKSEIRNPNFRI